MSGFARQAGRNLRRLWASFTLEVVPHDDELVGIGIRRRCEEGGPDHAEDGYDGTDAEGHAEDRGNCESRRAAQLAEGVAHDFARGVRLAPNPIAGEWCRRRGADFPSLWRRQSAPDQWFRRERRGRRWSCAGAIATLRADPAYADPNSRARVSCLFLSWSHACGIHDSGFMPAGSMMAAMACTICCQRL